MRLNYFASETSRRGLISLLSAAATLPPQLAFAYDAVPGIVLKSRLGYDVTPMSRNAVEEAAKQLTPFERSVSLQAVTETRFTGKTTNGYAWDTKQSGVYVGALSGVPLFSSRAKYDSGTGWPSFYEPVSEEHVTLRQDPEDLRNKRRYIRVEVLDAKSGAHLGHVFDDGPQPVTLAGTYRNKTRAPCPLPYCFLTLPFTPPATPDGPPILHERRVDELCAKLAERQRR